MIFKWSAQTEVISTSMSGLALTTQIVGANWMRGSLKILPCTSMHVNLAHSEPECESQRSGALLNRWGRLNHARVGQFNHTVAMSWITAEHAHTLKYAGVFVRTHACYVRAQTCWDTVTLQQIHIHQNPSAQHEEKSKLLKIRPIHWILRWWTEG